MRISTIERERGNRSSVSASHPEVQRAFELILTDPRLFGRGRMDFYIKRPLMIHACVQYGACGRKVFTMYGCGGGKSSAAALLFFLAIYLRSHKELNEVAAGFLYGGISLQLEQMAVDC
jgi:hypothetical protein